MKEKSATLRDVAKKAGVSVATVSYVLNYSGDQKISHDTRLKVFEAVIELNYNTDKLSRLMMKEYEKKQIGIVVSLEGYDKMSSVCTGFIGALWQQISEYGYVPVFFRAESMLKKPERLLNHDYNGLFYVGMGADDLVSISSCQYLPAILIDCYYENDLFFKLIPDYDDAVKMAMNRLGKDICVIMEAYRSHMLNDVLKKYIDEDNIYIYEESSPVTGLNRFVSSNQGRGFLVIGDQLALHMKTLVEPRQLLVFSYQDKFGLNSDLCKVLMPVKQIAEQGMEFLVRLIKLKSVEEIEKIQYFSPKFTYPIIKQ